MELPKNVTQIGESDKGCKIYVEDYVVSYIKQMNQLARNKDMAVAIYGTRKLENDITYLFIYGACKLDFVQREIKHLSQAQCQEIERLRRKYFPEHEFQGYRLLNGEMVEGFHICEQNVCRYVEGYAQFYEKNESMLNFMLATRVEESSPESINQGKYEAVKKRQEERREEYLVPEKSRITRERGPEKEKEVEKTAASPSLNVSRQGLWKMRVATAAVFSVLCIAGLALLWDEQNAEDLQAAAKQAIAGFTEQKLPDLAGAEVTEEQTGTLIVDGGLAEVVQEENIGGAGIAAPSVPPITTPDAVVTAVPATVPTPAAIAPAASPTLAVEPTAAATAAPPAATSAPTATPLPVSVAYTIQEGDTLIGISINQYGGDSRVKEICALNNISNPDDVKVGQVILLPNF